MSISLSSDSLIDHFFNWQRKHLFSQPIDFIEIYRFSFIFAAAPFSPAYPRSQVGGRGENELLTRSSLYFSKQSLGLRSSSWQNTFIFTRVCTIFMLPASNMLFIVCLLSGQDDVWFMTHLAWFILYQCVSIIVNYR